MTGSAIWWIRRDLRLHDNAALTAALQHAAGVVPVFILDPFFATSRSVADRRRAFLYAGLHALDADLRVRGSRLIVRHGRPEAVLRDLLLESGATAVFAEEDHSNYARARDTAVAAQLPLTLVGSTAVRPPGTVLKQDGSPYLVFTPFKKTWKAQVLPRASDLLPAPETLASPADLRSEPIPEALQLAQDGAFAAGETEGRRRLVAFAAERMTAYGAARDFMALDGTSRLSPYLRFGMVSARTAAVEALQVIAGANGKEARAGAETWLDELIWRDFYIQILYHYPHAGRGAFYRQYDQIDWRNDPADFEAWCHGRTGYPVVDAAMRQLLATGWMHNRARMIVASFLVKDLLIDWRWGERWFMQHLIDGDPAANNGGWQWSAGTGTDAAPYFRIFNPVSQSQKFDPDGDYIRRWVPELARVEGRLIHEPWKLTPLEQRRAGVRVGGDYPLPIVDHGRARERTLAAYKAARAFSEN